MSTASFVPMSEPVRKIFSRLFIRLDHAQHYYTAYLLAETETEIGDFSRPVASISRKRQLDRSDAKTWKVTHADEHATPIVDMDSRMTLRGTENHMKRAIAEFLYARELAKAAKARETKAEFKKWFGACRKLARQTHIDYARDIGSIDIAGTRLVYSINYSDMHGNEHADWRNGLRRYGRVLNRAARECDFSALRGGTITGKLYRRTLIAEIASRRDTLESIPGKPAPLPVYSAAHYIAGMLDTRKPSPDLFSAESLAELAGIEGITVIRMDTPESVVDVHNVIARELGERDYMRGATLPALQSGIAEALQEPNAGELRQARLFNGQPYGTEPDWKGFTHLELAGVRNESDNDDETNMQTCHYTEAQIFSVYGRMADGDCDLITDITDRDSVLDIVGELIETSRLPCLFAHNFGMR